MKKIAVYYNCHQRDDRKAGKGMKITVTFTEKELDFLLQCIIARRVQREDLIEKFADDRGVAKNQKEIIKECDRLFATIYQSEIIKEKG